MSLTEEQISKIAKLARIEISNDEKKQFSLELSKIIDWVEMLKEVNTDNVPQMTSVVSRRLLMRQDIVNDGNIQDQVLKNAKNNYGCFVVPKVIDEN